MVEATQVRWKNGHGRLAFGREKSVPSQRGASRRTVRGFASACSGFTRRFPFCNSRQVAGRSCKSWGHRDIRAPVAVLDTSIDFGRELLDTTIRNVRNASHK